ncbi:MAG: serine--tRNA ligase, partial [Candidatus Omnitrophica bacterium]|nr:serine--tRNA ligase [Candidatus Omnitrophota bacterium]
MLDIKFIRQNAQLVREALSARGDDFDLDQFLELDEKRRSSIKEIDDLRQKQNKANEEIKALLGNKKDISGKVSEMKKVSEEISGLKIQFKEIEEKFEGELLNIPNISHSSTPQGNASCNKIVKTWGKPKEFSFKPLSHVEIAERLGII